MKKVAVIGGSGFIGKSCVEALLEREAEIFNVDRKSLEITSGRYHERNFDLFERSALKNFFDETQPDYLLHLAWYTEHGKFWDSLANIDWTSLSLDLVRLFYQSGGSRALAAGTCAEYDWSDNEALDEEKTPLLPTNFYGLCKRNLFQILNEKFNNDQQSFAWGRVFHLYGPGEPPNRLIPYIIRSLKNGEVAKLGHCQLDRDFLHVDDVGQAFASILFSDVQGAVNISSGERLQLKEIALKLKSLIPGSGDIEFAPFTPGQPESIVASTSKLKSTGFSVQIPLDEGLSQFIESM